MSQPPSQPRRLERGDAVAGFTSGAGELDEWLTRYAWTDLRANNAVIYVTLLGGRVVGYYAVTVASVELSSAPDRLQKGGRPAQLPCLLLARLAVDRTVSGSGVGAGLLRDALQRCAVAADSVGAAAVLVHARDRAARAFYLANGDFLASPMDDLQLFAPMKDVKKLFA